jgi:hypothetical protein
VIASNSLVSPELQLATESQLFKTFNTFNKLINSGFFRNSVYDTDNINPAYESGQFHVRLNPRRLAAQWDTTEGSETDKAAAIVDYLDFYLNAGQLADSDNTGIRQAMISNIAVASESSRYSLGIYGVGTAPAFMSQK